VVRDGERLLVAGEKFDAAWPVAGCMLDARLGETRRALRFPDGSQVQTDDNDGLDALLPEFSRPERWRVVLEKRWTTALAAVLCVFVGGYAIVQWGLPALIDRVAHRVPATVERGMGTQALAMLDRSYFTPSKLPRSRRDRLDAGFARLAVAVGDAPHPLQLEVREATVANAFALPGGTVIVTDKLVEMAAGKHEILAVLAHEIGHQSHRHLMRGVLRNSTVVVLLATLIGDTTSIGALVSGVPASLVGAGYSREFEGEADTYAFDLLRRTGYSPRAFARILQRMEQQAGEAQGAIDYVSTHPPTADRIAAARAAALDHTPTR
jgi:predicted Zn-dependent protease